MIDAHRGAFEYDWRARFHLPLSAVGESIPWGEAIRLTEVLARDPSSWLTASLNEWEYPVSREAMAVMDLFDLQHSSKTKRRPKPYPRPWKDRTRRTFGKTSMAREQLRALLDAHRAEVISDG